MKEEVLVMKSEKEINVLFKKAIEDLFKLTKIGCEVCEGEINIFEATGKLSTYDLMTLKTLVASLKTMANDCSKNLGDDIDDNLVNLRNSIRLMSDLTKVINDTGRALSADTVIYITSRLMTRYAPNLEVIGEMIIINNIDEVKEKVDNECDNCESKDACETVNNKANNKEECDCDNCSLRSLCDTVNNNIKKKKEKGDFMAHAEFPPKKLPTIEVAKGINIYSKEVGLLIVNVMSKEGVDEVELHLHDGRIVRVKADVYKGEMKDEYSKQE